MCSRDGVFLFPESPILYDLIRQIAPANVPLISPDMNFHYTPIDLLANNRLL
jgi:hypothetical protein